MINNIKRVLKILDAKEIRTLLVILFLTIIVTVLEMISLGTIPVYVTFILDSEKLINFISKYSFFDFIHQYSETYILFILSITLVAIFIFKNLFLAFFYYFNGIFLRRINTRIARKMYNNYLYSNYLFYISRTSAEITRNVAEVARFVGLIGHYIRLILELLILTFIILVTIKIDPIITLITFIIFGFFTLIYLAFIKSWLSKAGKDMQKFTKNQINILNQTYSAIKEIKINLKEKYLYDLFSKNIFRINKIILFTDIFRRLPRLILEIVAIVFVVSISIYFIFYKSSNTELISILTYIAVASIRLVPAFTSITSATSSIKYMEPSINIIESETKLVTNLDKETIKNLESLNLKKQNNDEKKNTIIEKISIKNLVYSYTNQNNLINNLNFEINKNQKIGIIGESGMGKTTFLNLLLGLIVSKKGTIKYNNFDILLDKFFLYNFIGYVPQDTVLFNDTVKNNITFGEDKVNDLKLGKVFEMTKLSDFINDLPEGAETSLGERGINISGGQRQRIGLARALYKDPQALFLDEATSSLDLENEREILKNIFNYCNNKILILISHRKETLKSCDYIVKLENGIFTKISNND